MAVPRPIRHPDGTPMRAYVETYGCQMNISDGELMQGILAAGGWELTDSPEQADVVLVNTCAIRDHAERRVLGRVGELNRLKQDRPGMVIGVTGCMAQRMGKTLLEQAPYVDLVMGPDGYRGLAGTLASLRPAATTAAAKGDPAEPDRLPDAAVGPVRRDEPRGRGPIAGLAMSHTPSGRRGPSLPVMGVATQEGASTGLKFFEPGRAAVLELTAAENYEGLEVRRSSRISAWVPVQRGCNYRCTYCIVPYVRGDEKNRDPMRVLAEVRDVAASGITEVTLLGQTVNSWSHGDWTFPELLRQVARVDGIRRVRYTSPHPNDLTPELIDVMAAEPAVCRQLHLPVQSGHDRTLKRMVRRYTVESYLRKVERLRRAIPDLALSTDVIVAFPGETDDEYEATLDLMREVRYDDAFLYRYSPRDGTPATRLPADQFIADHVARARLERLIEVQRAIQAEINAAEIGRVEEVLVERNAKSHGDMLGRTERYKVVAFPGDASLVNTYITVRLTATTGATFRGVRTESPAAVSVA
ncbi:MAG TPA: MiaB/RimO family radical SAM methylthiotransferase [Longimicrobiales bacterium]|nr:MiaB/RimO family radical SAM methylthiotransferase [Longimicrobiales bacterium]